MGIPPLIGFFGKQMVLSAALDKGFIFLSLIAITTSVIGAVYYLNIVKEVFFFNPQYKVNLLFENIKIPFRKLNFYTNLKLNSISLNKQNLSISSNNIKLSSSITFIISNIT
jgi:NADH-ubiquinone oxidoreductase chain 2